MSARLKHKLSRLENSIRQYSTTVLLSECTCRGKGRPCCETLFHTSDELETILYIPCPVHGLRDPGFIMFQGSSYALAPPDWPYCTCPPHPRRDFVMGKRPRPTDDEIRRHAEQKQVLNRSFVEEKRGVEEIIATFEEEFKKSRGVNV